MKKAGLLLASAVILAGCSEGATTQAGADVTLYPASIITLNPDQPRASGVAVKGGGITAIGDYAALKSQLPSAKIDKRFEDATIIPGLIDPHVHMTLGAMMYGLDFVPPWDMETPKGRVKGLPDKAALLARIADFAAQGEGPLILYGYHNLVQGDLTRQDLDGISATRPIFIWHYSGHDFYLNSAAIKMSKLTPALAEQFHGVGLDEDGALNGRIYEDAALALFQTLGPILLNPNHINKGWNGFEDILARSGVTTIAEMGYGIFGRAMEDQFLGLHYTEDDSYRLYLVPEHRAFTKEFGEDAPAQMTAMAAEARSPAVLPQVKLFTDAAFYSQTMKMAAPGYIGGQSKGTDGLWVTEPQDLPSVMRPYWEAGLDIHIHSNGDAAQDNTLAAFSVMPKGVDGQRLIIEHAGLITPDQMAHAAKLGIGISAASHYVNYMGEDYVSAIGEKTEFITPLASAMRWGIHTTVHSDAPLAPPQPLKAASVHMTRETRQGGVSNPAERLSPEQALRAVTIEAAWSLGLDDQIGSLEAGKLADFTILGADPLTTAAADWPGIEIVATMVGGKIHTVSASK